MAHAQPTAKALKELPNLIVYLCDSRRWFRTLSR